ncbi:phage holin family protein [Lysobacter pythonis]|uniref:Phage holin family protein n=1 Tax=Solilutibacter pythonis TaxID=2483112 RepID=A0A3M2I0I2_9GAMM|nr:phage holin family protein [Lysobacter pythonis]RMH93410.1 phage holin family protein [Lysobacter pythonis]
MSADNGTPPPDPAPDLLETLRQVGAAGRAGVDATLDSAKAMRTLVSADISLARSAAGRTLALTAVAIVFGAVAGLLLTAALVAVLALRFGLPWSLSLLIVGLLCLAGAGIAGWRAMHYFEHTRMKATRRQLARLGIGELAEHTPEAGSAQSTREATEHMPPKQTNGAPVKDRRGIDVTPP